MIIGIDNGKTGAAVALARTTGAFPVAMLLMPVRDLGDGEWLLDTAELLRWIKAIPTGGEGVIVAVEECPHHAKQKSIMRSMAVSYGQLVGALMTVPEWTVIAVPAGNEKVSWQRQMLGRVPKGQTKMAALAAAQSIWRETTWLASPRSTTPHTGLIDAALLAEHVRRSVVFSNYLPGLHIQHGEQQ